MTPNAFEQCCHYVYVTSKLASSETLLFLVALGSFVGLIGVTFRAKLRWPFHKCNISNSLVGVGIFDLQYQCLQINPQLAQLSEEAIWNCLGKKSAQDKNNYSAFLQSPFDSVAQTGKPIWNHRVEWEDRKLSRYGESSASYIPLFSSDGKVDAVMVVVRIPQ